MDDDDDARGAAAAAPDRALYARLGVRPDASDEDVRRAFRAAAATLHPDKVRDEALRPAAAAAFAELQAAYEVLGDPAKRDVYDVYGPEGLAAGMALADPGRPREALRREWEEFRARGRRERVEVGRCSGAAVGGGWSVVSPRAAPLRAALDTPRNRPAPASPNPLNHPNQTKPPKPNLTPPNPTSTRRRPTTAATTASPSTRPRRSTPTTRRCRGCPRCRPYI